MAASPQVSAKLRALMASSSARRSWSLERVTRRKLSMSASPMRILRAVVMRLVVGTPSVTVPPAAMKGGALAASSRWYWRALPRMGVNGRRPRRGFWSMVISATPTRTWLVLYLSASARVRAMLCAPVVHCPADAVEAGETSGDLGGLTLDAGGGGGAGWRRVAGGGGLLLGGDGGADVVGDGG